MVQIADIPENLGEFFRLVDLVEKGLVFDLKPLYTSLLIE